MLNRVRPFHRAVVLSTVIGVTGAVTSPSYGAAYVSGFAIADTTVSFVLNEAADALSYSINGGPSIPLDGTTKGAKTFTLGAPTDTFSVTATKFDTIGYTIPTGATVPPDDDGLSMASNAGGFKLVSTPSNVLGRFNSPRGIAVATNPNHPQFGTTYVANSQAGTTAAPVRTLGDGLYALKADQSDAFGKGNTATPTGFETTAANTTPNRISIGGDHKVYIADWSDTSAGVYRMGGDLTTPERVLAGAIGTSPLPAGQNHGSVTSVLVQSSANGITLYTIDEDLTSSQFTAGASTTDRNSLWRYEIGSAEVLPYAGAPTKISSALLNSGVANDVDRGLNGNFYLAQSRQGGGEPGLFVLSPDGSTVLFDSLSATRTLLGNQSALDILRNLGGIAVSPDQQYLAGILDNSDVVVFKLDAMGIPDLAGRLVIDTGVNATFARDIAFDAVGNLHYISSGQQTYSIIAPGGYSEATTSWNGTSYNFSVIVPEPNTALLLGAGALLLIRRRRK